MKRIVFFVMVLIIIGIIFSCTEKKNPMEPSDSPPAPAIPTATPDGSPGNPTPTPSGETPQPTATPDPSLFQSISASGITFQWRVRGGELDCIVSAPTSGWVAVGFNTSGVMNDANMIIGYVDDAVAIRDDHASGYTHAADPIQNMSNVSGTDSGGTTEIHFTIPLADDANGHDLTLVQGNQITILLAYGGSDSFTIQHGTRTSTQITL